MASRSYQRFVTCAVIVLALLLPGYFASAPELAAQSDTVENVLGALPDNYKENSLVIAQDGSTYAFVTKVPGGEQVVDSNGTPGKIFDQIALPRFSPATNRLFYWALDSGSGQQQIVLVADEEVIPTPFAGEGGLIFSVDGKRWVAMGGVLKGQTSGEVVLLIDGKETLRYADASYPSFSPDGKHLAYLVRSNELQTALIVDGKQEKVFTGRYEGCSLDLRTSVAGPNLPPLHSVAYLADGSLRILTLGEHCWTIFAGEELLASYSHNIWGGGPRQVYTFDGFESAASLLAMSLSSAAAAPISLWWERVEGESQQWRVMRDGKPVDSLLCDLPWDQQPSALSDDGQHYAYACIRKLNPGSQAGEDEKTGVHVIADGKESEQLANAWGVTLSRDGAHLAYAASNGAPSQPWTYYFDGRTFPLQYDQVQPPVLSDDGAHIAWTAQRAESTILALDGHEVDAGSDRVWGPHFEKNGAVVWIVKRGNDIVRVESDYRNLPPAPPTTPTATPSPSPIATRTPRPTSTPTPAPASATRNLTVTIAAIATSSGVDELVLEFLLQPGQALPGSRVEALLNAGILEVTLPNGQTVTAERVPASPPPDWTNEIRLMEGVAVQHSPPPKGKLPLNGMRFENYADLPSGPGIRIPIKELLEGMPGAVPGQYRLSWRSGDYQTAEIPFTWAGTAIQTAMAGETAAAEPEPTATTAATSGPLPVAASGIVNRNANLRTGPGPTHAVVGNAKQDTSVIIVGRNEAGDWYLLHDGAWIAAFLVDTDAQDIPVAPEGAGTTATPVP
jgi:hypothetical protein